MAKHVAVRRERNLSLRIKSKHLDFRVLTTEYHVNARYIANDMDLEFLPGRRKWPDYRSRCSIDMGIV